MPYSRLTPITSRAKATTPMMKNLSAASFDFSSAFLQPASRNPGPETSSRPTIIVMKSLDDAITTAPSAADSSRK